MEPTENSEPEMCVCVRCGHPNDCGASRCAECKAPLDDFAAGAPWEMGSATGSAYANPENWQVKPVVFWGVLVFFGPSAIWAILTVIYMLFSIIGGDSNGEYVADAVSVLMTLAWGALSIWAVYSVTKNYFRKDRHESEDEAEDS